VAAALVEWPALRAPAGDRAAALGRAAVARAVAAQEADRAAAARAAADQLAAGAARAAQDQAAETAAGMAGATAAVVINRVLCGSGLDASQTVSSASNLVMSRDTSRLGRSFFGRAAF
jgi:hypothetical protein